MTKPQRLNIDHYFFAVVKAMYTCMAYSSLPLSLTQSLFGWLVILIQCEATIFTHCVCICICGGKKLVLLDLKELNFYTT